MRSVVDDAPAGPSASGSPSACSCGAASTVAAAAATHCVSRAVPPDGST
jgi:hypothetical protein